MKKIFNWTFGSIFRTFGRIIAYLIIGSIAGYILSQSNLKINSLFLDNVKASILTEDVQYYNTSYISTGQSSGGWTNTDGMFVQTIYTNNNEQVKTLTISGVDTTQADYVQLTFSVSQPTDATSTSSLEGRRCLTWTCNQYCSSGGCAGMCEKYQCTQYGTWTEGTITNVTDTSITPLNFIITANYAGGWSTCQIEGNSIMCPTLRRQITSIDFHINFRDNLNTYTSQLMVHRSVTMYQFTTNKIIENQNQNTQYIIQSQNETQQTIIQSQNETQQTIIQSTNQTISTITDSTSPELNGTLDNNTIAGWLPPGPIDSIVTLPLTLLNSLFNAMGGTCADLTVPLPFIDSELSIPCMIRVYNDMSFGSFFNWIGIVASAFILYKYLLRLYKWIDATLTLRENTQVDWGGD